MTCDDLGYYHATGCNWTFSGKMMLDLASASKSSKSKSKSISFAFCLPPGTKPRQEHIPKTSVCWRRFIEIPVVIPQCHKTLKNYSDLKKQIKKQMKNESSWDFTIPKNRIKNTNFSEISSACGLCCHDGRIRLADHLRIICTREIMTLFFFRDFWKSVKMCLKFLSVKYGQNLYLQWLFFGGEPMKTLRFFGTNPIIQGLPAWLWGTEGADGLVWVTLGPIKG